MIESYSVSKLLFENLTQDCFVRLYMVKKLSPDLFFIHGILYEKNEGEDLGVLRYYNELYDLDLSLVTTWIQIRKDNWRQDVPSKAYYSQDRDELFEAVEKELEEANCKAFFRTKLATSYDSGIELRRLLIETSNKLRTFRPDKEPDRRKQTDTLDKRAWNSLSELFK